MKYIYQNEQWPSFSWDIKNVLEALVSLKSVQGTLLGKMNSLGFDLQQEAIASTLTDEVIRSSAIEGHILNTEQVRSSVVRRLGLPVEKEYQTDRYIEGIVTIVFNAVEHYDKPLTKERLLGWQASLFPTGYSTINKILTGQFRDDKKGPMQVVSGPMGKEKVHFQAPEANQLEKEIEKFLNWLNQTDKTDGIIKAGIAHLWFITLHPFEDGNGRIARTLTDMMLAKAEKSSQRFYSISKQMQENRDDYYNILEKTQKGSLDITFWLLWFIKCVTDAIASSETTLNSILNKALFWQKHSSITFNDRQIKILNKLLDDFIGNLTSSKWAAICKCSQDTANRDINDLLAKNVLVKHGQGRSIKYTLSSQN
ncbi:MAG: Fic family protein [Candidatus Omnitrophica bacterium]|nr:Fic family protein [Candidatus Omnitrophota bacterium]